MLFVYYRHFDATRDAEFPKRSQCGLCTSGHCLDNRRIYLTISRFSHSTGACALARSEKCIFPTDCSMTISPSQWNKSNTAGCAWKCAYACVCAKPLRPQTNYNSCCSSINDILASACMRVCERVYLKRYEDRTTHGMMCCLFRINTGSFTCTRVASARTSERECVCGTGLTGIHAPPRMRRASKFEGKRMVIRCCRAAVGCPMMVLLMLLMLLLLLLYAIDAVCARTHVRRWVCSGAARTERYVKRASELTQAWQTLWCAFYVVFT